MYSISDKIYFILTNRGKTGLAFLNNLSLFTLTALSELEYLKKVQELEIDFI